VLQRSRLPIVFTGGFNPHPKLTFGPPLTTGLTSDAEYLDLHFYGDETFGIGGMLAPQLPDGIKILQVNYSAQKMAAPAAVINHADYQFQLNGEAADCKLNDRIQSLLNSKELLIERKKEKTTRILDVRPFVVDMEAVDGGLRVRTKTEAGKSVRIDELLSLLFPESETLAKTARVHRLAMWVQDGDRLLDPMEVSHLSENHHSF
jgi:radical SAM-linked protein